MFWVNWQDFSAYYFLFHELCLLCSHCIVLIWLEFGYIWITWFQPQKVEAEAPGASWLGRVVTLVDLVQLRGLVLNKTMQLIEEDFQCQPWVLDIRVHTYSHPYLNMHIHTYLKVSLCWAWWCTHLIPALGKERHVGLCKSVTSLVCMVNSRQAGTRETRIKTKSFHWVYLTTFIIFR